MGFFSYIIYLRNNLYVIPYIDAIYITYEIFSYVIYLWHNPYVIYLWHYI